MRVPLLSSVLFTAVLAGGCHVCCDGHSAIEGSGILVSETREVPPFERISLHGGMELYVRAGLPQRLVVRADDNLQQHIRTEVSDGELEIRFEESLDSDLDLCAEIDLASLRGIEVAGSSKLTVVGVEGQELRLSVAGSCRGEVSGWVEALDVDIAGSGQLDLFELEAKHVSIDIAGSGRVETHAVETLDVGVAGSGKVTYRGQPRVEIDQAGSATVGPEK